MFCLIDVSSTDRARWYTWVPFMTVCTHSNKKRNSALLLWTELSSLLYTDSAVNKLRLVKWLLVVHLFTSLCPLTFLSVLSLYGKSLTTDWLHRKSTLREPSSIKATHHTYSLIDFNCQPTSKCSCISISRSFSSLARHM